MSRRASRDGFVLVAVLGALIVLTGLAAAVGYLVRTAVIGAAAVRSELVIDALTRSGFQMAGYELFELERPAAAVNGQQIRLDDGVLTLFVTAESGKIDLNGSSPEVLAGLWRSIGGSGLMPEQFAARVKDFRDADQEVEDGGGAERQQYEAAGPDRLPADAAFEQIDDIQNVLGVTPEAARAMLPLITTHNPGGKASAFDASPEVIRAVPGGPAILDKILALRAKPPPEGDDADEAEKEALDALGEAGKEFSFERTSAAFTVRVEVARGDARRSATAILTKSRSPDALYYTTDVLDRR